MATIDRLLDVMRELQLTNITQTSLQLGGFNVASSGYGAASYEDRWFVVVLREPGPHVVMLPHAPQHFLFETEQQLRALLSVMGPALRHAPPPPPPDIENRRTVNMSCVRNYGGPGIASPRASGFIHSLFASAEQAVRTCEELKSREFRAQIEPVSVIVSKLTPKLPARNKP